MFRCAGQPPPAKPAADAVKGPKVLLIVHETEDLGKEVVTAESIDYQNYGNYEVALLPAKENSHADAIKAYYHQINIIKNNRLMILVLYSKTNIQIFAYLNVIINLIDLN